MKIWLSSGTMDPMSALPLLRVHGGLIGIAQNKRPGAGHLCL
ncbi:hypothetical protein Z947_3419 [Sulfitobacter geojensis]|nr:hypothetical protein Z947_3419 [Sulfitobacter geojensis]NYI28241.1 hypothetical protein [Sulfitobacter geojensis]